MARTPRWKRTENCRCDWAEMGSRDWKQLFIFTLPVLPLWHLYCESVLPSQRYLTSELKHLFPAQRFSSPLLDLSCWVRSARALSEPIKHPSDTISLCSWKPRHFQNLLLRNRSAFPETDLLRFHASMKEKSSYFRSCMGTSNVDRLLD